MSVSNQRQHFLMRDKSCKTNALAAAPNTLEKRLRFTGNQAFSFAYDDEVMGHPVFDFEERLDQTAQVFVRLNVADKNEVGARVYTRQLSSSVPLIRDAKMCGNDVVFTRPFGQTEKLGFAEVRHGENNR